MDVNPLMPGGNKKVTHTCVQLQVCLRMCDLLLPPNIKGLTIFAKSSIRYMSRL